MVLIVDIIHDSDIICVLDLEVPDYRIARTYRITRTAAEFPSCFDKLNGSILVIGNAPSALHIVCKLIESGIRPAIVIGTLIGFVHFITLLELEISLTSRELKSAAESKEVLRNTDVPSISNIGTRGGGTPIAVTCINELISNLI